MGYCLPDLATAWDPYYHLIEGHEPSLSMTITLTLALDGSPLDLSHVFHLTLEDLTSLQHLLQGPLAGQQVSSWQVQAPQLCKLSSLPLETLRSFTKIGSRVREVMRMRNLD